MALRLAGGPWSNQRAIFKLTFFRNISRLKLAARSARRTGIEASVHEGLGETIGNPHGLTHHLPGNCRRRGPGISLALLLPAQAQFWDWGTVRTARQQQHKSVQ